MTKRTLTHLSDLLATLEADEGGHGRDLETARDLWYSFDVDLL